VVERQCLAGELRISCPALDVQLVTTVVGKPSATDQPTWPTQPFIRSGSINRILAIIGWGSGGNVTSAERLVTLCDRIWHVSSRSSEAFANCFILLTYSRYNNPHLIWWRSLKGFVVADGSVSGSISVVVLTIVKHYRASV